MKFAALTFGLSILLTSQAQADVTVRFIEGAPKDRFVISTSCAMGLTDLTIDMAGSKAGLIFDTTGSGAGVEVFQPLEFVSGQSALNTIPEVKDGDASVGFSIQSLTPETALSFTIDVDDTLSNGERGQIIVTGSEIEGAQVRIADQVALFDQKGVAVIALGCAA